MIPMTEEEKLNDEMNQEKVDFAEINDLIADPFANPGSLNLSEQTAKAERHESATPTYELLPEPQKEQAEKLAKVIDVTDLSAILNYGAAAQKEISTFSHSVLDQVTSSDTGEIGEAITNLMHQLSASNPGELDPDKQGFFSKLFNRVQRSVYEVTAKYQKIGAQVDKIALKLEHEQDGLLKDNKMLAELYDKNMNYYQALNIYISAGELRIQELEEKIIPEALKKAENSPDQMDVQKVNDLNQFLNRLEKRVHDLKVTRQLTIQQAPQIRLIQNTNQQLAEKIQSSINTAIPLWKNQIVITMALLRQHDAVTAQRKVSDTTNELLRKNSEMLKQSSLETARENERAIVDIETLEATQANLIETLQETLEIQREGSEKRRDAEQRLVLLEDQMRDQLLEITERSRNFERS